MSENIFPKCEDLHLILLSIISCSFLREGAWTLNSGKRRLSVALESTKHSNPTAVKISFSKKMLSEPCGIKTFQSGHQTMWVWAVWCLQQWSKEMSDNSPSPALTATAKGRIFNNNIRCANHKELIRNQRQSGLCSETDWQLCSGFQAFTTESKPDLFLEYQRVIQYFHLCRQIKRCCVHLSCIFVFRKDSGGWVGTVRGAKHKHKKTKWLNKTPYREKILTGIGTRRAEYLTKESAHVVAEKPVSEQ